ncbi:hypothetical protein OXIME_000361 [Oxyplasma meridianum]|uniref:DUF2029 domain-containing protein n=1 Tax=Oxyplasma meridianum TaxID=3073602 RepID=A0AAX4NEN7_9ARCH
MENSGKLLNNDRYLALIVGTLSFYLADLFLYMSGYFSIEYIIIQWVLILYGIFLCSYSLVIHNRVQLPIRTILKILFVPLTFFILIYTFIQYRFSNIFSTIIIIASLVYLVETPFDNRLFKVFSPNRKLQDRLLLTGFSIAMPLIIFFIISNIYLTLISLGFSIVSVYLAFGSLKPQSRKEYAYFAVIMQFAIISLGFIFLVAPFQTDELLFDFYSAILIFKGHNPYIPSFFQNVFNYYRVPIAFRTPLTTGGFAKGLFYPDLAAIIFLPSVILNFDPRYEVFLFTVGIILIAFFFMKNRNLPEYFPMLVLMLAVDIGVFAFAGYSDVDIIWAFFLIVTIITRNRKVVPSVTMGIALALKQIAWVFFPFYIIFIWKEKGFKNAVISALISALVFFGVNLPYIILSPHVWLDAILAPETMPLIGVGQGISIISFAGFYLLNHLYFTLMFFTEMVLLIVLYFFSFEKYKYAMTTFPLIVFFFNFRLLVNYIVLWPVLSFFLIWDVMKIDGKKLLKKIPRMKIKGFKKEIAILSLIIIIPVAAAPIFHIQNEPISIKGVHVYTEGSSVDKMKVNITVEGNFSDKIQFRIYPEMFLGNASANGYLWKFSNFSNSTFKQNYSHYTIVPLNSTYEFPSGISFRLEAYYGYYSAYYSINYQYSGISQSNSSLKSIFGSV